MFIFLLGEGSGILNFKGITQFLLIGWMKQLNGTVTLILQEVKETEREGEREGGEGEGERGEGGGESTTITWHTDSPFFLSTY